MKTDPQTAGLLIQMRALADRNGDRRSLVAIAAQFEREAGDWLERMSESIKQKSHRRNAGECA